MDRTMLWPSLTDHKSYVKTNMLGIYTSSFSLCVHELPMLSNVTQWLPGLTWSWFKCRIHKICCLCYFSPVIPLVSVHRVSSLTWDRSHTPPAMCIPCTRLKHMRDFRQDCRPPLTLHAWRLLCAGFLLPF